MVDKFIIQIIWNWIFLVIFPKELICQTFPLHAQHEWPWQRAQLWPWHSEKPLFREMINVLSTHRGKGDQVSSSIRSRRPGERQGPALILHVSLWLIPPGGSGSHTREFSSSCALSSLQLLKTDFCVQLWEINNETMDAAAVTAPVSKSVGDVELNAIAESNLSFSKSRKQTLNPDIYQIFLHIKSISE